MANKEPWATGLQSQPHIATDTAGLQYFSPSQSLRLNAPELHLYKEPKTQSWHAWDLKKKTGNAGIVKHYFFLHFTTPVISVLLDMAEISWFFKLVLSSAGKNFNSKTHCFPMPSHTFLSIIHVNKLRLTFNEWIAWATNASLMLKMVLKHLTLHHYLFIWKDDPFRDGRRIICPILSYYTVCKLLKQHLSKVQAERETAVHL